MLEKQNLLGLTQVKLKKFFSDLNEKPFRTKQIMQWIYHQGALDFGDMHNFSKDLRQKLQAIASIELPEVTSINNSKDGVIKWVIKLGEENHIETVYIPQKDRGTLCISSQVGCSLACTFCSTGYQGFNRNLENHEIIAQVLIAQNHLKDKNKRISNVDLWEWASHYLMNPLFMMHVTSFWMTGHLDFLGGGLLFLHQGLFRH